MPGPLVLVAGSADPQRRDYDPPVSDCAAAQAAAEQLGGALARAGCRIMVYSGKPQFIEAAVVRGFAAAKPAGEDLIVVRFPSGSAAADFAEHATSQGLFDFRSDPHPEWEASYYRSLREAEGVLLIGGGQSVVITGHLALGYRMPLMAIATFGGAAHRVWRAIVPDRDLPTREDAELMARPHWAQGAAEACVTALLAQHARRQAEIETERRREADRARATRWRSIVAGALFLAALATLPVGFGLVTVGSFLFQLLLFFSGALAGASGATIRMLWNDAPEDSAWRTAVLGLAAGGVSAVLYLMAQVAANPAVLGSGGAGAAPQPHVLLLFAAMIGFIAGFTFDAVYRKLAQADVVQTEAIVAKKP